MTNWQPLAGYRDFWWNEFPVGVKVMDSETGEQFESTVHGWKDSHGKNVREPVGNIDKIIIPQT